MRASRFVTILLTALIALFSQVALAETNTEDIKPASKSGFILEIDGGYSGLTMMGLTLGKKLKSKNENSILSLGLYARGEYLMNIPSEVFAGNILFQLKFHLNFGRFMVSPFLEAGLGLWSGFLLGGLTIHTLLNCGLSLDWFATQKFYVGIEGSLNHYITVMADSWGTFAGTITPGMALHLGFVF